MIKSNWLFYFTAVVYYLTVSQIHVQYTHKWSGKLKKKKGQSFPDDIKLHRLIKTKSDCQLLQKYFVMLNECKRKRQIHLNINKYSQAPEKKINNKQTTTQSSFRYSLVPTRFLRLSSSQYKNCSQIKNLVANQPQEISEFLHTPKLNFGSNCYKMLWISKEQMNTEDANSGKRDPWGLWNNSNIVPGFNLSAQ